MIGNAGSIEALHRLVDRINKDLKNLESKKRYQNTNKFKSYDELLNSKKDKIKN